MVEYARSIGADYILRGIRNEHDYGFERGMRHVNEDLDDGVTTVFLMPPRGLRTCTKSVSGFARPAAAMDGVALHRRPTAGPPASGSLLSHPQARARARADAPLACTRS